MQLFDAVVESMNLYCISYLKEQVASFSSLESRAQMVVFLNVGFSDYTCGKNSSIVRAISAQLSK
jgi:hypothetical protein